MGGDSPDLLSRLTKQQCLAPSIAGMWPEGSRVKEQHTLRSEQMEKGGPPYCVLTYLLYPGLGFKNRPKKNVKNVSK